jgi:hypothetical protein
MCVLHCTLGLTRSRDCNSFLQSNIRGQDYLRLPLGPSSAINAAERARMGESLFLGGKDSLRSPESVGTSAP